MRSTYITLIGTALMVMAASTLANAQAPSGPGVFGVYDAASGTFRPVPLQALPAANNAGVDGPRALSPRAGKLRVKVIIKVRSGSPASTLPSCYISINHSGVITSYGESVSLQGTRTGNDALCDVLIPYSWPAANDANPVSLSLSVSVGNRGHSESPPSIPLPADGATTLVTLHVVS